MSLTPVGDLGIALKSDVDDFHKGMRTSKESVGLLTGSIAGLSKAMRNVGAVMTAAAGIAGAAMLALSRRAERVNEKFREIGTITSKVSDTQAEYGELVSDLNQNFGLQGDKLDVLEGLYQSVSAGVDEAAGSQREFLSTAAKLAVVGRVDLATTVDVLSTSINAYGEDTEFANRASDALFRTVQAGKVTLDELAPVMGRITALGSELGVNIEELGASMALLTRTGFEARVAATGVRAILRGFMKPSEQMKKTLRDVALEQDFFADKMDEGGDVARRLADDYREATQSIKDLEAAQKSARESVEENSLAIQEARLMQTAIEEERREEVEGLVREQIAEADSTEELQDMIENYRFEMNKARVQEEQHRQELEEEEEKVQETKNAFSEKVDAAGDLEDGIGTLVVENKGLVDTLSELRQITKEEGIGFDQLFPRTRGLQAALALVGEDAKVLNQVFAEFRDKGKLTKDTLADVKDETDLTKKEINDLNQGLTDQQFEEATGPAQEFRNAVSKVKDAITELGQIFLEDTTGIVKELGKRIEGAEEAMKNMNEETRESISRFLTLAIAIGLVLGPLLLFTGQLALISTALGVSLIPFLGVTGALIGILAKFFLMASDGGEQFNSMIGSMGKFLSILIGFLYHLKNVFVQEVLPGLIIFGQGILDVLQELGVVAKDEFGTSGSIVRQFGRIVGNVFAFMGRWLSANAEEIAAFARKIIVAIREQVIPALIGLGKVLLGTAKAFIQFLQSDRVASWVATLRSWLDQGVKAFQRIVKSVRWFAGVIQEQLKKSAMVVNPALEDFVEGMNILVDALVKVANSTAVAKLFEQIAVSITITISIIASLLGIIGQLIKLMEPILVPALKGIVWLLTALAFAFNVGLAIILIITEAIRRFIDILMDFMGPISSVIMGIAVFIAVIGAVIAIFNPLTASLLLAISVLIALGAIFFAVLEWIWNTATDFIPDTINYIEGKWNGLKEFSGEVAGKIADGLLGFADILVEDIPGAFLDIRNELIGEFGSLVDEAYDFGEDMVSEFIDGMQSMVGQVGSVAGDIAGAVASKFPSSPAEEGPLSKPNGPKARGEATASGFAEGISSEEDLVDEEMNNMMEPDTEGIDTPSDFSADSVMGGDDDKYPNPFKPPWAEDDGTDVREDFSSSEFSSGDFSGMGGGREININEKAIFFEEGAFQGVSDEEIPEMVETEVDESLDEIVEDIESSGGDSATGR